MSGTGEGAGELFHSYTSRVSKYISSGVLPISICNSFAILMKAFLIFHVLCSMLLLSRSTLHKRRNRMPYSSGVELP